MPLRLFIALEPAPSVRRRLVALQAELRAAAGPTAGELRWIAPESIHLTLQFLGAVPEERRPDIAAAMGAAAAESAPLRLEVRGAGGFPSGRRARIVWAGVGGEVAALGELAAALGRRLAPLGFTSGEHEFTPHLTLARSRERGGASGLAAALATCSATSAGWRVTEVTLFRSVLSSAGARYEPLDRATLGS